MESGKHSIISAAIRNDQDGEAMKNPNPAAPPDHAWAVFGKSCATVLLCAVWLGMLVTRPEKSLFENIGTGLLMLFFSAVFALFIYLIWLDDQPRRPTDER